MTTTMTARVGDIDVAYDVRGSGPPLLLIAGFGMARAMWDDELCDQLAGAGFTVVRMDNRDTGGSTRLDALGVPDVRSSLVRTFLGLSIPTPYRLEDMAADALGLMTALGHPRFHAVGASMGGMIAQTMAIDHPERLLSMTSAISTAGGRRYSFASPRALVELLKRPPRDPVQQVEHIIAVFRVLNGNVLPFQEARVRKVAEAHVESHPSPAGAARQLVAILDSSGRRRARLPSISTPTLVIHGSRDPLLPLRGGLATARLIPGAELLVVDGMGHLFPSTKYPLLVDSIARHAHAADLTGLRSFR